MADGFAATFADPNTRRLGEAMIGGISNLFFNGNSFVDELRAYSVFGDPATVIRHEE